MGMSVGDRAASNRFLGFDSDPSQDGVGVGRLLKRVCTPVNLAVCTVVALGWFALIGWTGAGPDGWQARLCADLDLQPRACAAVTTSVGTAS